ncbi:unnamed protein product [Paramecium octaurelia]|uniref:Protein kinase domain-containing protein n=1 Tax=Paramecium octaurelia TaxID=43137 RepID=A0A8S1YEF2_PAROT|nr:unnamed protein product [Paramecium octaurelia]
MIGKISFDERVKVSYQCKSDIQFNGKLEQVIFEKNKGKALTEFNHSCMLQIFEHSEKPQGNGNQQFDVIYNCQEQFQSLRQILERGVKKQDKIEYFFKLLELANDLKQQKMIHFNIKPSNVILYKDRFYLIDFGFLKDKPADLIICINYIQIKEHDDEQKRNLYPYLNDQFLKYIKENNGVKETLQNMSKGDIENNDRYALGVMMFELFVPLKNIYQNFEIETCANQRKIQLGKIYDDQEVNENIIIEQIKNIIQDILFKYELPSDNEVIKLKKNFLEYQKGLQPEEKLKRQYSQNLSLDFKEESEINELIQSDITLQEKMNSDNKNYISSLRENNILQFDPNLLYYLNKQDLQSYYCQIQNLKLEELKNKTQKILAFYHMSYYKMSSEVEFSNLGQEDQYYILNSILTDYKMFEYKIQDKIQFLNSIWPKEFKFNQINRELTKKKQQIQNIEQTQVIKITQRTDQAEQSFIQKLQNTIPNIMRFLEYEHLLKQKQNIQELIYEFEQITEQIIGFYSAKLKNQNVVWTIFENIEKCNKLFIGNSQFSSFEQVEGRIIEETQHQIIDYQTVKYNIEYDNHFGDKVEIYIYNKSRFKLISFYNGGLEGNKYQGKGLIKDWINNYEYDGYWKQGKKHGQKGTLKILNKEVLLKNEFSELDVEYSDDYLKYGITPNSQKKSYEIKYYFQEALKVYKYKNECNGKCKGKCNGKCNNSYLVWYDCSKLCNILGRKFSDQLRTIKNSLKNCKKAGERLKTNSN